MLPALLRKTYNTAYHMRRLFTFITLLLAAWAAGSAQPARPKLVVGIVIDQMRWDYLYRYHDRYCEGGFRRLLSEGYSCENTRIPYVPSLTAIGHTTIYTGSVPSIHGIAGNNFVKDGQYTYCTADSTVTPVGTDNAGCRMSPRNLWTTTVGDELRIATNHRAKVIGVALKDRAAILPAGNGSNGAYWFDTKTGRFVTSSFYMNELPQWVKQFNKEDRAARYLSNKWETLFPIASYTQSTADANDYEDYRLEGMKPVLPLDLPALRKKHGYDVIRYTPFGNALTFDFARAAIEGERLGMGSETDMLTVSCSSTDILGHRVGTHAVEMEDMYLRLDRQLADFLTFLDGKIGRGEYLVFLSADHGGANNVRYLRDRRIPSGYWPEDSVAASLNKALEATFPALRHPVKYVMNYQIFFDTKAIEAAASYEDVKQATVNILRRDPAVLYVCDQEKAMTATIPDDIRTRIVNGYNRERSGGVQVILKPAWNPISEKGSDHGAWNPYDTHIPLIFMGWGITHGATTRQCYMTDIAPTIAALLHIQAPNGCIGQPVF